MTMQRPFMCEFLGTPEAGKTTSITMIKEKLEMEIGLTCLKVQESAELLPTEFQKESIESHFWMKLNTAKCILECMQKDAEILLIDRGIEDTLFWNMLYMNKNIFYGNEIIETEDVFFTNLNIKPDFVIMYSCPIEESIRRRGGEGRKVNRKYLKEYNKVLTIFAKGIKAPLFQIDTLNKSPTEVCTIVLNKILTEYEKFKK